MKCSANIYYDKNILSQGFFLAARLFIYVPYDIGSGGEMTVSAGKKTAFVCAVRLGRISVGDIAQGRPRTVVKKTNRIGIKYFLFAMPFVIYIFAFSYIPLFGWAYIFVDYKVGVPLADMPFVGLKNFFKLINEHKETLRVLRNTLAMSSLGLLCSPLPAVFAIMLNDIKSNSFKRLVQTTTTLPNFISWIVVFGVAYSMFSSSGFVNTLLTSLHIPVSNITILGNNQYVWLFQTGLSVWKSLGWNAIIYIAAIASIDVEQYDAATVDGANKLQSILHITIPGLMPTYFVLLLLNISNLLNNGFEQYFTFYNSMVSDKIEVLDYYVYKIGILVNDYSYSIAIGMLKTLFSIGLLLIANRVSRHIRGESLI